MSLSFNKVILITVLFFSVFFTGCKDKNIKNHQIKVGVIMGAEVTIAETAKQVAKEKFGLDVELVIFNDYVMPNEALSKKSIDLNVFQHKPYLDQQVNDRGYKLAIVGNTFVYPIAGYSKKIKSIDELKNNASIAIPNDPTNLGRSLLLMEKQGLIKLKAGIGLLPTILDIIDNPKNFRIIELEAPQLIRALDDKQIMLAIINTAYSSQIGLTPSKNGILVEDKDSPYVNIIVAREDNKDTNNVKDFVHAFQSEEVYKKADEVFNGGAIKGW